MANKNAKKIAITFNRDNPREAEMLAYIESKVSMSIYIKQLILDKMVSEGYFNSTPDISNTNYIPPRYVSNRQQKHIRDIKDTNKVHIKEVQDTLQDSIKSISDSNRVHIEEAPDDDLDFDNFIVEEVVENKKADNKDMMSSLFNSMNNL